MNNGRVAMLLADGWQQALAGRLARRVVAMEDDDDGRRHMTHIRNVGPGARLYEVVGGVAMIPVVGFLLASWPWIDDDYATGYDVLRAKIAQAFADPDVKAIVLWCESPGGEVSGCFELVDWIFETKGTAGKPVAAILADYAFSAAYAIASAADSIAVPSTGGVGSIGVLMMQLDMSKWLDELGLKVNLVYSGAHKVDGNPFEALPDSVRADWQAEVDGLRGLFTATVGRNRSAAGAKLDAAAALATEARCYGGIDHPFDMKTALGIGLIDAILTPEQALQQVLSSVTAGS
jgi:signal peptide peptidase SppA